MAGPLPKPIHRSRLRLAFSKAWYVNKRRGQRYFSEIRCATKRQPENLNHIHKSHGTPVLRKFSGVEMQLQINKKASLEIAASCIDGLLPRPGETFSLWRPVGKPTAARGFKMGFVLRNGSWRADVPQRHKFEVFELDHEIRHEYWGGYSRHNALYHKRLDIELGMDIDKDFMAENHVILM
jgi:hypothetical protein